MSTMEPRSRSRIFNAVRGYILQLHLIPLEAPEPIGGDVSRGTIFTDYGARLFKTTDDLEAWFFLAVRKLALALAASRFSFLVAFVGKKRARQSSRCRWLAGLGFRSNLCRAVHIRSLFLPMLTISTCAGPMSACTRLRVLTMLQLKHEQAGYERDYIILISDGRSSLLARGLRIGPYPLTLTFRRHHWR